MWTLKKNPWGITNNISFIFQSTSSAVRKQLISGNPRTRTIILLKPQSPQTGHLDYEISFYSWCTSRFLQIAMCWRGSTRHFLTRLWNREFNRIQMKSCKSSEEIWQYLAFINRWAGKFMFVLRLLQEDSRLKEMAWIEAESGLKVVSPQGLLLIGPEQKEHTSLVVISYVCSLNVPRCGVNMCSLILSKCATRRNFFPPFWMSNVGRNKETLSERSMWTFLRGWLSPRSGHGASHQVVCSNTHDMSFVKPMTSFNYFRTGGRKLPVWSLLFYFLKPYLDYWTEKPITTNCLSVWRSGKLIWFLKRGE